MMMCSGTTFFPGAEQHMTINTKKADRRELSFGSLDDIRAEIDRLEQAHNAGTLTSTGNWTPGQIFWHCASLVRGALDGFPEDAKPPLWLKLFGRMIKAKATAPGGEAPTGFKIPPGLAKVFEPSPDLTFEQGASELRVLLDRIASGATMEKPSPLFGELNNEQWTNLQVGHCQMHFSFMNPG